jgi:hypothetical protein
MPREAADAMARRQFGNRLRLRESSRDVKLMPCLEDLVRDVRHGLRALRRTPVFTSVAILTLALRIGANTAIFSIVNGVLLRPLAYPHPAQLTYLSTAAKGQQFPVSVAEYLEFQQSAGAAAGAVFGAGAAACRDWHRRSPRLHGGGAPPRAGYPPGAWREPRATTYEPSACFSTASRLWLRLSGTLSCDRCSLRYR